MKKLFQLILLISITTQCYSQAEVSNWWFEITLHLKFTGDSAQVIDTYQMGQKFHSADNNACISDANGNFLFYSNGVAIFNANLDTMPNGQLTGIFPGHIEAAQNIIIPRPEHSDRYYVVVPGHFYTNTGLWYSEVDMTLDNGLGDVIPGQSNILLHNLVSEKVTAVFHANGKDVWIITHELYSSNFLSYLVTEEGIQNTPVVTSIGAVHVEPNPPNYFYNYVCKGDIKTSTCGRRVALASKGLNLVELFDFDTETGMLSNPITFNIADPVCIEFSSDGNVLYFSTEEHPTTSSWDTTKIYQSNLLLNTSQEIINSTINIGGQPPTAPLWFQAECPLQLAYNDKIYFGCFLPTPPNIGTINEPHLLDTACSIHYTEHTWPLSFYGGNVMGLPNFFRSYLDKNIFANSVCFGDTTMLYTKNSYLFDSIRWEISDPLTGLHTFSNQDTVYHLFSQAGSYDIHCFRFRDTLIDDFIKKIQVYPVIDIIAGDTTVCEGELVQLSVNAPGCTVEWHTIYGVYSVGSTANIAMEGDYFPVITNYWGTCGDAIDTFEVDHINFFLELGPDIEDICITNPVELYAVQYNVQTTNWSTGETSSLIYANESGLYSVTVTNGNCQATDQINITYDELLELDLGTDIYSCDQDSVPLNMNVLANSYAWQPGGQTTSNMFATSSGTYIAEANNACGTFTDTIKVTLGNGPLALSFPDTVFCNGDSLYIDLSTPDGIYLWSTGSTDSALFLNAPGTYTTTVSNPCGDAISTFELIEEFPFTLNLIDTFWLVSDSILVDPLVDVNYQWSTGSIEDYIWLSDTGSYSVTATNSCTTVIDTFEVLKNLFVENLASRGILVFPNPTKDYLNIQLYTNPVSDVKMDLYNLEGRLVMKDIYPGGRNFSMNINYLPPGLYFCKIYHETDTYQFKVIKL